MANIIHTPLSQERKGVIAVVYRGGKFLVIKRSQFVRAPGRVCFPGGGIEQGETEEQALIREMQEELSVEVTPVRRLWTNFTRSGVKLYWWKADLLGEDFRPDPREVEHFEWMTPKEFLDCNGVLETNRQFLAAWLRQKFRL